jgi:hypothetical protein
VSVAIVFGGCTKEVHERLSLEYCTTYVTSGAPPLELGAVQLSDTCESPGTPVRFLGALGGLATGVAVVVPSV